MKLPAPIPPPARSWRNISQGGAAHVTTKAGRRRRLAAAVRNAALVAVGLGALWAGVEVYLTLEYNPSRLKEPVRAVPLRQIAFSTDGVLNRAWLDRTLSLPSEASLMTLDLVALERRLLASGQVKIASLRRRFGDNTLVVALQERSPVVRIQVQEGDSSPRLAYVARDGVVYLGEGAGPAGAERLPWLDGVRLRRTPRHDFEPVPGMELVADLLATAQTLAPELSDGWTIVSLSRLAADQEIAVRSRDIPEIVFDAKESFSHQIAKLAYIADSLRRQNLPPMQRVNLALGEQVPVEMQAAAPSKAAAPAAARPAAPSTAQRRDF